MNWQRAAIVLTIVNLVLLMILLAEMRPLDAQGVPPVLRGRALELVDDRGSIRAEIKVLPAQPKLKMPDGSIGYPEAVQLRLINSKGGPNVKLVTTEDGAGLVLGGDGAYVQILSRGANPFLKILPKDGRELVVAAPARARRQ
jgi:hypothetical protein